MPYALSGPRIYYERQGSGEPLLLITGFTISAAVFDPVLARYARRFETITYDNRGAGRSGAPLAPTSMPELAADAARLLDAIDVPSAHVLGLSMGGMIAQELAIRFPERVRGLVLGGTSPGGPRALRPAVREVTALAAAAARGLTERTRPWLAEWLFSEEFRTEHPDEVERLLHHFDRHRAPPHGVVSQLWASIYHDTYARLPRIQAPTLVLAGEHDRMTPVGNARLLAERIPDAELHVIPASGHAFILERPDESFAALTGWLEAREPIAAGTPRGGVAARAEPVTRALGLPIGAMRTGASLVGAGTDRILRRR
jgi:pimeloyl-ACP methyl ester carboxylesterase